MSMATWLHKLPILLLFFALGQCASKMSKTPTTYISIYNTGSYAMQSPQVCYYEDADVKDCLSIEKQVLSIAAGESKNFKVRAGQANQKVRLVFPFDLTHEIEGINYQSNCHILVDLFLEEEKSYFAEAQIVANLDEPKNGFTCSTKIFGQNLTEKALDPEKRIISNAKKYIRYRVPRLGENRNSYINNYDWQ